MTKRWCSPFGGVSSSMASNLVSRGQTCSTARYRYTSRRMKPGQRKEERTFWAAFEAARPRLVGAMFDVLAKAMHRYPAIHLPALPRMADFCRWGYAVADALAWRRGVSPGLRMRSVPRTRLPSRTTLSPLPSSRSSVAGTLLPPRKRGTNLVWHGRRPPDCAGGHRRAAHRREGEVMAEGGTHPHATSQRGEKQFAGHRRPVREQA